MTDFQEVWAALVNESSGHRSGRVARRVGPIEGPGTFLAIDCSTRKRWFLAELDASRTDVHGLPDWREIQAALVPATSLHSNCFGLELESIEYVDVFSALTRDLISALSGIKEADRRLSVLRDRLQKWNRFLKEHGHRGLSEDQVRGLFAELWLLQQHLLSRLAALDSVRAWKGPDAEAHDFRRGGKAIEVKSSGMASPNYVAISNEEQLDDAGLGALWLHVIFLDDAAGTGSTLPEIVESVRGRLAQDAPACSSFEHRLQRAGYLDDAAPTYARRYEVADEASFHVREGFPRLIQPPAGIHAVKYRVHVNDMQPFRIGTPSALDEFCRDNDT